mmetsp:Transcript_3005/g.5381  ORF Transcript_3005/g.5381 Transcript_3005/m.5381 type:complete len:503 (+) Transcript_3005:97-1605(+)
MGRFSDLLGKERREHAEKYETRAGATGLEDLLPKIGNGELLSHHDGWQGFESNSKSVKHGERKSKKCLRDWTVTNDELLASSLGLTYRRSPSMEDKAFEGVNPTDEIFEKWGSIVHGFLVDEEWLQVGSLYLPVKVNDAVVIIPAVQRRSEPSADEEAPRHEKWKTWKMPLSLKQPARDPSQGSLYEVVHDRVVGRPAPSVTAPMQAVKTKGSTIVLFEYDETGQWRQGLDAYTNHLMWWMIDHEDIGPLLRPQGKPLSIKPLNPLCVAAQENLISDAERFLELGFKVDDYDITGRTPLMIAMEADNLECCVLLLQAGAKHSLNYKDPSPHAGKTVVQIAKRLASEQTLTVLQAVLGFTNFDPTRLEEICLFHMKPGFDDIVQNLINRATRKSDRRTETELTSPSPTRYEDVAAPATNQVSQATSGEMYEVVHDVVFIRKEASTQSEKIGLRRAGDAIELFETDSTGNWARVCFEVYNGMKKSGWMLLRHENLGELLRPMEK